MKNKGLVFGWILGVACCFGIGYWLSEAPPNGEFQNGNSDQSSESPALFVGGFLPEQPAIKVYLKIQGGKIQYISKSRPNKSAVLLDTESWIFPGLINLHNHLEYNFLPFWPLAQGQFSNRFEWRGYTGYKDFASFNKKAIPDDKNCASIRWAEFKELVTGVTTTEGLSGRPLDLECAVGFGPRNIEVADQIKPGFNSEDEVDTITPDMQKDFFQKIVIPMQQEKGLTYAQVIEQLDQQYQISAWLKDLVRPPQNLVHAMQLLTGKDFGVGSDEDPKTGFARIKSELKAELLRNQWADDKTIDKKLVQIEGWIFGDADSDGYLKSDFSKTTAESSKARNMLLLAAVVKIPDTVRRHFANFEFKIRQPMLREHSKALGFFLHLSEGHPNDAFSQQEYDYLTQFGMNFPENVLIHGVGMSPKQLDQAAQTGQSMVWSPVSNLLLYGETLNIKNVQDRRINLSIGSDWSSSGSKSLLDEVRFAKKYLDVSHDTSLSDEELTKAVTVNPAKALRVPELLGKVAPGYLADLMLVQKKSIEPYRDFVQTTEKEIELVVVGGEPQYGNAELIRTMMEKSPGADIWTESLDVCGANKAFRLKLQTKMDAKWDLRSLKKTEETLKGLLAQYRTQVQTADPGKVKNLISGLDPLFACQDSKYQTWTQEFLEKTWPEQRGHRVETRAKTGLKN